MRKKRRMNRILQKMLIFILTGCLSVFPVYADSYISYTRSAQISSVRIRVELSEIQPGTELMDDPSAYITIPDNDYYGLLSAEWLDNYTTLKVGDTPRIRVYLNAFPKEVDYERYTKIWLFMGGYSGSNVQITNGTFVSSSIKDSGLTLEVIFTTKPLKGSYDAPSSVYWDGQQGLGKWTASVNDSGLYDVYLKRGSTTIKKLECYSGNFYNFYPYMTKEGDYTFQVRTTATQEMKNQGAKVSDWQESTTLYLTKDQVSDGSGQTHDDEKNGSSGSAGNTNYPNGTGNESLAGWVTDSTGTRFRYPDGTYAKNGWAKINGYWYLFDAAGRRLTGWQSNPSKTGMFYMDTSTGIMQTGWLKYENYWYYLEPSGDAEGRRVTGTFRDIGGNRYYFNDNGIMVTGWFSIGGKWYYFYPEGYRSDGKYGFMAVNTRIGDFWIGADGTWQN